MKINTSPLYLDRLDSARQQVFDKLKRFKHDFVLAGGTALMLQIGHRMSYDFDCFSPSPIPKSIVRRARLAFGSARPTLQTPEMITIQTENGIDVTFVQYPYKSIKKPVKTSSISLFQIDDLAADKAFVVGRRGAWRDYVDIFFLLKWKLYTLKKMAALAEKKYGQEFNPKLFLEQLVYFDDLDISETIFFKDKHTNDEIKSFLEKTTVTYLKKQLII